MYGFWEYDDWNPWIGRAEKSSKVRSFPSRFSSVYPNNPNQNPEVTTPKPHSQTLPLPPTHSIHQQAERIEQFAKDEFDKISEICFLTAMIIFCGFVGMADSMDSFSPSSCSCVLLPN